MQDFRKLRVWETAHALVLSVYEVTSRFPEDERYGLTSQLRRASASVPTNIAEGCGRYTPRDTAGFFQVAMGSACEVEYSLLLAYSLKLLRAAEYQELDGSVRSVKRMLVRLIARMRAGQRC